MSEQMELELDALRTENANLKTALHTAERMLGNMQLDCTTQRNTMLTPLPPYGIHGNKFPGVIWPDPKKMQFDIVRDYDPMAMGNREKPLNLTNYRESPRRRRSDFEREAED